MLPRIHHKRASLAAAMIAAMAILSSILLVPGCDEETPAEPRMQVSPTAALVSHTGCKGSRELAATGAAVAKDCIEYSFAGENVLLLTHANAAFNCCPGEITAAISIANDTITIVEHESESACRCLCLYDLEYRFEGLAPGTYTIVVGEPYVTDQDEPLRATIDLAASPSGSFCVDRDSYPWNAGGAPEPAGRLVSRTECHDAAIANVGEAAPTDLSCAVWKYGGNGVLSIVHVNAAFNCCPGEIAADITIRNDTITIVEREEQSLCDCSCLFDLKFEIWNLEPRPYTILFVEPYVQPGDERLTFTFDPANLPNGWACACRTHYPWGYQSTIEEDREKLKVLRDEILALIATPSCGGDGECRFIGLGDKPCGGFWEYLVYSTSNVDRFEISRLASRYNAFNHGFNCRYHIYSDCMLVAPPRVGCVEGACAALKTAP